MKVIYSHELRELLCTKHTFVGTVSGNDPVKTTIERRCATKIQARISLEQHTIQRRTEEQAWRPIQLEGQVLLGHCSQFCNFFKRRKFRGNIENLAKTVKGSLSLVLGTNRWHF